MKRKIIIFAILVAFTIVFSACSSGANSDKKNSNPSENSQPTSTLQQGSNYNEVKEDTIPSVVKDWFNSFGNKKGAYVYQHPDYSYIRINSGERSTGGYGIKIKDFQDNDYEKKIIAEFTEPAKDALVTQAITYPSIILSVKSNNISSYKVVTDKGEDLTITDKTIISAVETPKTNDVIGSPFTIKGKVAVFEGSFIVRILDEAGKVLKEEIVQTAGAPAWGSYEKDIVFIYPKGGNGSIEIGEYSAKDGSYILHEKVNIKFKD